jgi:hypothetical protein
MPTALIFAGPAHSYFYSTRTRTCKVRLGWAKVGPRRCQNVPETCMLVDGAYGNTMQQNNGQTSQKRNLKRYITFVFEWYAFSRAFLWGAGERNSSVSTGRMDTRIAPRHGQQDGACR